MDFTEQFKAARRVSVPLIMVRTADSAATVRKLTEILDAEKNQEGPTSVLIWDVCHGIRPVNDAGIQAQKTLLGRLDPTTTTKPTEALVILEKTPEDCVVFFSNAHSYWADDQPAIDRAILTQGIWNLRDIYKEQGALLVLLCSLGATLPDELTEDVLVLTEPLPTEAELEKIVTKTLANANEFGGKFDLKDKDQLRKCTDALVGLAAFPAEQSLSMCISVKNSSVDYDSLWERKRQVIELTNGLSVYRGKETFADIGGIENIKKFSQQLISGKLGFRVVVFIDEIEKAIAGTGTDLSGVKTEMSGTLLTWMQDKRAKGLLLLGPPGAAKSACSKCIGNTAGVPTIIFDFSAMQSSLVGSSGARLRQALAVVDAVSQGKALFVATCNTLDALSTELRRRFRTGTFFFDLPTKEEREAIWQIYLRKYGFLGQQTLPADDGWTGAEIEECCEKAFDVNISLVEASNYIVPISKSAPERIEKLRREASGKFISASKPGIYQFVEEAVMKPGRKLRVTEIDMTSVDYLSKPGQA